MERRLLPETDVRELLLATHLKGTGWAESRLAAFDRANRETGRWCGHPSDLCQAGELYLWRSAPSCEGEL